MGFLVFVLVRVWFSWWHPNRGIPFPKLTCNPSPNVCHPSSFRSASGLLRHVVWGVLSFSGLQVSISGLELSRVIILRLPQRKPYQSPSPVSNHLPDCTSFCPIVELVVSYFRRPEDSEYSPQTFRFQTSLDISSVGRYRYKTISTGGCNVLQVCSPAWVRLLR